MSFMFNSLDDHDLEVVIDAMDEKKAPAGSAIITEGESGQELYVVEEGQLDCFKKFVINSPSFICYSLILKSQNILRPMFQAKPLES